MQLLIDHLAKGGDDTTKKYDGTTLMPERHTLHKLFLAMRAKIPPWLDLHMTSQLVSLDMMAACHRHILQPNFQTAKI